ncbi:cytochrome c biogenesis CcdA family protein [Bauldia sp.]|uniref:cytochrome c biogenesis CcdA family protein n=1 Tax=Bauldia sp. TaxID=2575872 RepID=UPI003BA96FE4
MENVGFGVAIFAGLISFLSPCVLPLVPPYLGYLAGVSLDQLTGESPNRAARRTVFFSSIAFVFGFSTVFVLLGAAATTLGQLLRQYLDILTIVGGGIIIIMGLHFLGVFRIGLLHRQARMEVRNTKAGPVGSYVMGLAFGFGWTPCIGPILSLILGMSLAEDTVSEGVLLLAAYSAGLGIPFIIAGLFAGSFMNFMKRFRSHMGAVEKTMGALLVVTGVLFVTGQITTIAFWLLDLFPGLAQLG